MRDATLTKAPEDAKILLKLCRDGRLYEIEKWIANGKPLDIPTKYASLLQVAVETGFHSLIELIAKHENNQKSKNAALADAVSLHRLDFVELLVENGAEVKSAHLQTFCWNGIPIPVADTGRRRLLEYRQRNVHHCHHCQTVVASNEQTESFRLFGHSNVSNAESARFGFFTPNAGAPANEKA